MATHARRSASTGIALIALGLASGPGPGSGVSRDTFDDAPAGSVPEGYFPASGRWEVVALPEGGKALAQTAEGPNPAFNVVFASRNGPGPRNVDMTVRLRAVAGRNDQGGGLVWRARDARNYYIARFNPLEDNFRVYKVVDGKRTQLQSADVKRSEGWHTLRVWMFKDHIRCDLDSRTLLDVRDSTFEEPGMIGFWTKSDARTQFDDFERFAFE